jgi:hypothetical protein
LLFVDVGVVTSDGDVFTWGSNERGELGLADNVSFGLTNNFSLLNILSLSLDRFREKLRRWFERHKERSL